MLSNPICSAVIALALVIGRKAFSSGAILFAGSRAVVCCPTAERERRWTDPIVAAKALASLDINASKLSLGGVLTRLRVVVVVDDEDDGGKS